MGRSPRSRAPSPPACPTLDEERAHWHAGRHEVAGVDEVGAGALAGPVVAAAVVLPPFSKLAWADELRDSKQLLPVERERLAALIRAEALDWSIGIAPAAVVDSINVLRAGQLAMERAVAGLRSVPHVALIDGNRPPALRCEIRAVVNGDALIGSIAAASIMAKVTRDRLMASLDTPYPGYGFASHKGYSAPAHLRAIFELGVCPLHRRSFAPVRSRLVGDGHLERLLDTIAARSRRAPKDESTL